MLTFQLLFSVFLIILVLSLRSIVNFLSIIVFDLRYITGLVIDRKVDDIFFKSIVISEIDSKKKKVNPQQQIQFSLQNSHSIVVDVMLQHGLNPKDYNISKLIQYYRHKLGLNS